MGLHTSIETTAFVSGGVYATEYGAATLQNICNLFAFYGIIEDAPNVTVALARLAIYYFKRRRND